MSILFIVDYSNLRKEYVLKEPHLFNIMENLPFRKLQQMCKKRNLSPCGGKGVKKENLIALLKRYELEQEIEQDIEQDEEQDEEQDIGKDIEQDEEQDIEQDIEQEEEKDEEQDGEQELMTESDSFYKNLVKEHDPSLYLVIEPYVPSMPDFRPRETLAKMKKEEQGNWRLIYEELTALAFDETSQEIMEALNEEDLDKIEDFIFNRIESVKIFSFSYPALIWLLHKVGNKRIIDPLLVASGLYLKDVFKPSLRKYVRDEETAQKILKEYPKLKIPVKKIESRGDILLLFYGDPKEFDRRIEDILSSAISMGDLVAVTFSLNKGKLSKDQVVEIIYESSKKLSSIQKEEKERYEEMYLYLLNRYNLFGNIEKLIEFMRDLIPHFLNKVYFTLVEKEEFPSEWNNAFFSHTLAAILSYNDSIMDFQIDHNFDHSYRGYLGLIEGATTKDNSDALEALLPLSQQIPSVSYLVSLAISNKSKSVLRYLMDRFKLNQYISVVHLASAIESGDEEIIGWILSYVNPNDVIILYEALKQNEDIRNLVFFDPRVVLYPEVISALLSRSVSDENKVEFILSRAGFNPILQPHLILTHAISEGNPAVVRLLLNDKRIRISSDAVDTTVRSRLTDIKKGKKVVRSISYNKNLEEILLMLLQDPRIDPSINNNEALKRAMGNNDIRMVEILLTSEKVRKTLTEEILEVPTDSSKIKDMIKEALMQ